MGRVFSPHLYKLEIMKKEILLLSTLLVLLSFILIGSRCFGLPNTLYLFILMPLSLTIYSVIRHKIPSSRVFIVLYISTLFAIIPISDLSSIIDLLGRIATMTIGGIIYYLILYGKEIIQDSQINKQRWTFFIFFAIWNLIINLSFLHFGWIPDNGMSQYDTKTTLFLSLLWAPIIETILFQVIILEIIYVLYKLIFKQDRIIVALVISQLIFSLCHNYGISYSIGIFISTIGFPCIYALFRKDSIILAIVYTMLLHLICNSIGVIMEMWII